MSFLSKIHWALTVPISSFLGFLNLKKMSVKKDRKDWVRSFYDNKVLIVGSGPSLDKVDESYFLKFDTIVYINHAVKCSGKINDEYFFSTDINVVKGIEDKEYWRKIVGFGNAKSIVAPIFFQQSLFMSKYFKESFSWIVAHKAFYKIHKMSRLVLGIRFPVTAVYWPEQPDERILDNWFLQENQIDFFPVIETTSALSALLFVAKYKPQYISLIGCDFSAGRSELVVKDCPEHVVNIFSEAKEKFYFLQKYFSYKNISVENDSWK